MKRTYITGEASDVQFFIGKEIEHTPAFGKLTLFVTGIHPVEEIALNLNGAEHIFFGANHSFNPQTPEEWDTWQNMIQFFLDKDYLCSLDILFRKFVYPFLISNYGIIIQCLNLMTKILKPQTQAYGPIACIN